VAFLREKEMTDFTSGRNRRMRRVCQEENDSKMLEKKERKSKEKANLSNLVVI
jgi:hypothetical protein